MGAAPNRGIGALSLRTLAAAFVTVARKVDEPRRSPSSRRIAHN